MIAKMSEKHLAIEMRKNGFSYREIREKIPVAKSTLSLWFKDVNLSKPQKQRLTQKRIDAALRGAAVRKNQRIVLTKKIFDEATQEVDNITDRELWLIGVALYWAEGSKEKEHIVSQGVVFGNSDPLMIKLFLKWLQRCVKISHEDIGYSIYIHETSKRRTKEVKDYWAQIMSIDSKRIPVYYKKHSTQSYRKNRGKNYYGVTRITVRKSSSLNRKISGWVNGICRSIT